MRDAAPRAELHLGRLLVKCGRRRRQRMTSREPVLRHGRDHHDAREKIEGAVAAGLRARARERKVVAVRADQAPASP